MKFIHLKSSSKLISRIGLGCLQLVEPFSIAPHEIEAISLVQHARELGINFFDTSDIYGLGQSEIILGKALDLPNLTKTEREKITIATKCGLIRTDEGLIFNGSKSYIKNACEKSLARLGTNYIDIYYLHRIDNNVSLLESMEAMAELLEEGKIHYVGLSEVTLEQILEASKIVTISFVQNEFSLVERTDQCNGLIDKCAEIGIYYVPYCPLSRGFLSSEITTDSQFAHDDFRGKIPRLQSENLLQNVTKRKPFENIASELECSTAQLALAWMLALGEHIIPIPGTRTYQYLEENVKATDVIISSNYLSIINKTFHRDYFQGERSPPSTTISTALSSPKLNSKLRVDASSATCSKLSKLVANKSISSPVFSAICEPQNGRTNSEEKTISTSMELEITRPFVNIK